MSQGDAWNPVGARTRAGQRRLAPPTHGGPAPPAEARLARLALPCAAGLSCTLGGVGVSPAQHIPHDLPASPILIALHRPIQLAWSSAPCSSISLSHPRKHSKHLCALVFLTVKWGQSSGFPTSAAQEEGQEETQSAAPRAVCSTIIVVIFLVHEETERARGFPKLTQRPSGRAGTRTPGLRLGIRANVPRFCSPQVQCNLWPGPDPSALAPIRPLPPPPYLARIRSGAGPGAT